jgi:hypothetical protein
MKLGELKITMAGRAAGKSTFNQMCMLHTWTKREPPKIIWHHLPGRKLKATWEVQPRGREHGLNESDMEPIEAWLKENIPTARRMSFDTWLFKSDKHITMFLLMWS